MCCQAVAETNGWIGSLGKKRPPFRSSPGFLNKQPRLAEGRARSAGGPGLARDAADDGVAQRRQRLRGNGTGLAWLNPRTAPNVLLNGVARSSGSHPNPHQKSKFHRISTSITWSNLSTSARKMETLGSADLPRAGFPELFV